MNNNNNKYDNDTVSRACYFCQRIIVQQLRERRCETRVRRLEIWLSSQRCISTSNDLRRASSKNRYLNCKKMRMKAHRSGRKLIGWTPKCIRSLFHLPYIGESVYKHILWPLVCRAHCTVQRFISAPAGCLIRHTSLEYPIDFIHFCQLSFTFSHGGYGAGRFECDSVRLTCFVNTKFAHSVAMVPVENRQLSCSSWEHLLFPRNDSMPSARVLWNHPPANMTHSPSTLYSTSQYIAAIWGFVILYRLV